MKYFNDRSYRDCMMVEVKKIIKNIEEPEPTTKKQNLLIKYSKNIINKIKKLLKKNK